MHTQTNYPLNGELMMNNSKLENEQILKDTDLDKVVGGAKIIPETPIPANKIIPETPIPKGIRKGKS